jgi:hypothetical protein
MSSSRPARLPRYQRAKYPPNFRLTERDLHILGHLHDLRLLDRPQIQRLEFTPAGASACKRRLTLLYHHGYVDRRYAAINAPFGAARSAYCLDRLGADALAAHRGKDVRDLDWRRDDMQRDALFLAHLLDTNDVYISLRSACTGSMSLDWLTERALRRELTGVKLPSGARPADVDLVPIPDAYATVVAGSSYAFAIELDRGTVEEKRVRQKIVAYGEWVGSGAYRTHVSPAAPRVLFIVAKGTNSAARVERLVRWCEAEGGRSLFWFAEHADLVRADILRDPIWTVAGDGVPQRLLDGVRITDVRTLPRVR